MKGILGSLALLALVAGSSCCPHRQFAPRQEVWGLGMEIELREFLRQNDVPQTAIRAAAWDPNQEKFLVVLAAAPAEAVKWGWGPSAILPAPADQDPAVNSINLDPQGYEGKARFLADRLAEALLERGAPVEYSTVRVVLSAGDASYFECDSAVSCAK